MWICPIYSIGTLLKHHNGHVSCVQFDFGKRAPIQNFSFPSPQPHQMHPPHKNWMGKEDNLPNCASMYIMERSDSESDISRGQVSVRDWDRHEHDADIVLEEGFELQHADFDSDKSTSSDNGKYSCLCFPNLWGGMQCRRPRIPFFWKRSDDSQKQEEEDDDCLNATAISEGSIESTNEKEKDKSGFCRQLLCRPCFQIFLIILFFGIIYGIGVIVGWSIRRNRREFIPSNILGANTTTPTESDGNDNNATNVGDDSTKADSQTDVMLNITIGAYYYPWSGQYIRDGGAYLRSQLDPPQVPAAVNGGNADTSATAVSIVTRQLEWSHKANIALWVTSWWGPGTEEDLLVKDVILEHDDIGEMKIAIHYETPSRIQENDYSQIRSDMDYLCEHYFNHPNYYRIDDRPVIVIYISRKLEALGQLQDVMLLMRSSANKCGHNIYFVGDHVFQAAPDESQQPFLPFFYFDAVTNYDVYGSMGSPTYYAGDDVVNAYYLEQEKWRFQAMESSCGFIPAASPGFNNRARSDADLPPLSRRLNEGDEPGTFFSHSLRQAIALVDPLADNLILINSFNRWSEDSQIEPVTGDVTDLPNDLTQGLSYEGYGELYLDILRDILRSKVNRTNIFTSGY